MQAEYTPETIYNILAREIAELQILPGEMLSENSLCQRFGLSRTPIRSVLQRLEEHSFVKIVPYKGTQVTPIDLKNVGEMIYCRLAVETMVLRDFIRTAKPPEVETVRYLLNQLVQEGEKKDDPDFDVDRFISRDIDIHRYWYKAMGKQFLWKRLTTPQADYTRFIRLDVQNGEGIQEVIQDHLDIMEAVDHKREDLIEGLLSRHFYGGVRRMGGKIFDPQYKGYFTTSGEDLNAE